MDHSLHNSMSWETAATLLKKVAEAKPEGYPSEFTDYSAIQFQIDKEMARLGILFLRQYFFDHKHDVRDLEDLADYMRCYQGGEGGSAP